MDRLNEVQQVAICKLSWYRLAIGLIRMGLDEDEVDIMSKESLREAWAHMVTHGRDTPSEGGSSETISARALRLSEELQPERLPPKKLVYEEREREKEREKAKRNEKKKKKGTKEKKRKNERGRKKWKRRRRKKKGGEKRKTREEEMQKREQREKQENHGTREKERKHRKGRRKRERGERKRQ